MTEQELNQMTKVTASSNFAVNYEQTFYLSITNECSIRVFRHSMHNIITCYLVVKVELIYYPLEAIY